MLRLASQHTPAVIVAEHTPDDVDLRAFALFADGQVGAVDVPRATRGAEIGQWSGFTWPPPTMEHAIDRLMPVGNTAAASMAAPPLMVIIRY